VLDFERNESVCVGAESEADGFAWLLSPASAPWPPRGRPGSIRGGFISHYFGNGPIHRKVAGPGLATTALAGGRRDRLTNAATSRLVRRTSGRRKRTGASDFAALASRPSGKELVRAAWL
jgi:hypothetical protein